MENSNRKSLRETRNSEEFFQCPHCGEESVVTLHPGWNKLDCPYCSYYLIVYQDVEGGVWLRTPGVLESRPELSPALFKPRSPRQN